jgi:hypothetical protein
VKAKYLVYPGYVISKNDGEKHYISFMKLIELYRVDPRECINASMASFGIHRCGLKRLMPDTTGRYKL